MSLRFRQRIKVLPGIYLNIGRNGVSTTIGPRGANINIGKQGVYLNTGIPGTGISNREKLFGGDSNKTNLPTDIGIIPTVEENKNTENSQEIITSEGLKGLRELLDEAKKERESIATEIKQSDENIGQLKSELEKKQNGIFSKLFTKKETIDNLQTEINEAKVYQTDLKNQFEESAVDINIQFDVELEEQHQKLNTAFWQLIKSHKIWDITARIENREMKSSAKTHLERVEVTFKMNKIDFIKSKQPAFHFQNANGSQLFIYPAFVLLMNSGGEVSLIDLKEVDFNFHEQRFIEQKENIPSDSKIIDYAWAKVNKDGTPDMRFKGNYQTPVVKYGAFTLTSSNGLNESYNISNYEFAESFANEFKRYIAILKNVNNMTTITNAPLESPIKKDYYDLIHEFAQHLKGIAENLKYDEQLLEKINASFKSPPANIEAFIIRCIEFDLKEIFKILYGKEAKKKSIEIYGLVTILFRLFKSEDVLGLNNYESFRNLFHSDYVANAYADYFDRLETLNNENPFRFRNSEAENNITSNPLSISLSLPAVLQLIEHPLFDEYANLLYRFATVISKADSTVSKNEDVALKKIFEVTHQPLLKEENKAVKISNAPKANSLDAVIEELNSLIGLGQVKQEVNSLVNFIKVQKAREASGLKSSSISYHCVFTGNPGTGKTTIARIVAKIFKNLGVVSQGQLVETDRSGLVAEYLGQTAVKVNKTVDSAINGILFIDEAYSLVGENKDDFGKEAVATLIKRIEDDRDKLIVILAGYTGEMKTFIGTNPGFKSRFNRHIEFADYSPVEMLEIFESLCSKSEYKLTDKAKKNLSVIFENAFSIRDKSFGNGRFVRNIFEKTQEKQANRIANISSLTKEILITITEEDIP